MSTSATTNANITYPDVGTEDSTWGTILIAIYAKLDDMLRGYLSINAAGSSDVTLSEAQWNHHSLKFTGTLTGNISVEFPDSREGNWWLDNSTDGAFTLTAKTVSGTGTLIPQGQKAQITSDGTNVELFFDEGFILGEVRSMAFATAPARWLECDGSAVSRTTYSALFAKVSTAFGIGDGSTTFNLPDHVGRSPIGVGTGDATNATAWTLGEKGGDETHTLTAGESEHNHTGPSHNHTGTTDAASQTASSASGANTRPDQTHDHDFTTDAGGTEDTGAVQNVTATAHNTMHPVLGLHFFIYAGV